MEKPFALIIEDDRDIAALFRHVLDIAGYHTEIILHGKDASIRLHSARPDIVLLDLNLPGVPGEQLLEQMRADERLKDVPVVVVTAFSQIADGLRVEPDLVLLKPVNLDQLSILVQRLRSTTDALSETPWDVSTHLYTRSFFNVRLSYSLERVKQLNLVHFGVLFADLDPFAEFQAKLDEKEQKAFLHETATRLRTVLRPTDTIAYVGNGLFLILIEEFTNPNVPVKISARVQMELGNYLSQTEHGAGLKVFVGVVLCDADYPNAESVMRDVELACQLAKHNKEYVLYDREMLAENRNADQRNS